ncbi:hypothetical protein KEM52_000217 [Ascosphaera acerosa]|nr:hypothetical protein KEM52_000217 [Ascosphaera acerosa]
MPFAPYIKTHALVTLVQKGLQYWELEQAIEKDGTIVSPGSMLSFWGPVPEPTEEHDAVERATTPGTAATAQSRRRGSVESVVRQSIETNGHGAATATTSRAASVVQEDAQTTAATTTTTTGATAAAAAAAVAVATSGAAAVTEEDGKAVVDADGDVDMTAQATEAEPQPQQQQPESELQPVHQAELERKDGQQQEADEQPGEKDGHGRAPSHEQKQESNQDGEVLQNGDHHADEVEDGAESPPSPVATSTLVAGASTGVQIGPASSKSVDLAPQTTILATHASASSGGIIAAAWQPHNCTTLAVYGDDSCGLWKSPSGRWSEATATYHPLVDGTATETDGGSMPATAPPARPPASPLTASSTVVTAMAWNPSGTTLAVATYTRMMGTVTLFGPTGAVFDTLPDAPFLISGLKWSPDGAARLLLVLSDTQTSQLAVWDQASAASTGREFALIREVDSHLIDVAWPRKDEVFALATGSVQRYAMGIDGQAEGQQGITLQEVDVYRAGEDESHAWTHLCATTAASGEAVAVAASEHPPQLRCLTHPDIVIPPSGDDDGSISSLQAFPLAPSDEDHESGNDGAARNVLLAVSLVDGTTSLYRLDLANSVATQLHRLSQSAPISGVSPPSPSTEPPEPSPSSASCAISPDTYAVACAAGHEVSVWSVQRGGEPVAQVTVPVEAGREDTAMDIEADTGGTAVTEAEHGSPRTNGRATDTQRLLAWDSDSKRLALIFQRKIAIIDFQR